MNKHTSHGLEFQTSYTYSKDLDDTAAANGVDCGAASGMTSPVYAGTGYGRFSKGPACSDNTHNIRINVLYHIPNINANNVVARLEHGWWAGAIWSAQTGFPFTPVLGTNRSQSQIRQTQADYVNVATSADVTNCQTSSCKYTPIPFNHKTVITHNPLQWYNPNMFAMAPMTTGAGTVILPRRRLRCRHAKSHIFGTSGNALEPTVRPRPDNVDFSLNKDTKLPFLGEAGNLEFRAEFFNILNHPNFNMPNGTVLSGSTKDFSPYAQRLRAAAQG